MKDPRDFARKPKNWFLIMIVLAVMAALFISFFQSMNTNLPSYQEGTDVEPVASEEPELLDFPTTQYTNDEYGFSMDVPADWQFVVKSGADSYVDDDGSIISFSVSPYDPTLNLVTQDNVSNDVTSAGGLLGAFSWLTNSSYAVVYEIDGVDYFELVTWDLETLIRVSAYTPAENYQEYANQFTTLFDTFVWEKPSPIPDGYTMYYNDYGSFEFPVPTTWTSGIEDGCFVAVSEETGANYRITVSDMPMDFSQLTQLDYVNTMGSGKSNYMLNEYQVSNTGLSASASFLNDGVQYMELHQIMVVGSFQYELLFQYPLEMEETCYPAYLEVSSLFRVF